MPVDWDRQLSEWSVAGVVDAETAERIRRYQLAHVPAKGARWSAWFALAFGAALLAAGVLLLVSAIWNEVPPLTRLALVVSMVALFHFAAGAAARWSGPIGAALHVIGSLVLGPAIFMAGGVLNLDGHWPTAVLLWALGAAAAWMVRRDAAHAALVAVLVPAWLASEWAALGELHDLRASIVAESGIFLLALAYLTTWPSRSLATHRSRDGSSRSLAAHVPEKPPAGRVAGSRWNGDLLLGGITTGHALWWLGLLAFVPAALTLGVQAGIRMQPHPWYASLPPLPPVSTTARLAAWAAVLLAPLAIAAWLRGRGAWMNAVAAAWLVALALLPTGGTRMFLYPWLALGCLGLAAWGIRETRSALINLSTFCFGLLVLFFYFDNVMDKMGRAASLIGLGLLFLAGGYLLERIRRRMVARTGDTVVRAGGGVS